MNRKLVLYLVLIAAAVLLLLTVWGEAVPALTKPASAPTVEPEDATAPPEGQAAAEPGEEATEEIVVTRTPAPTLTPGVITQKVQEVTYQIGLARATILGISVDDQVSHKKFQNKHKLPFTLLADSDKKVTERYGVKNFFGLAKRVTFVIDREGIIRKIYPDVDVSVHGQEVLAFVKTLQKK